MRHRKPENFLSGLARNGHGMAEEQPLTPVEAADEALVMGLRLAEGIDALRPWRSASGCLRSSTGRRSIALTASGH